MQFIVSYKLHQSPKVIEKEIKMRNYQSKWSWPHHTSEISIQQGKNFIAESTEIITLDQINDVPNPVRN